MFKKSDESYAYMINEYRKLDENHRNYFQLTGVVRIGA
jgi:hypothetical protein